MKGKNYNQKARQRTEMLEVEREVVKLYL